MFLVVMTEKDAMAPILRGVIDKWNVPFAIFRGNPSDTQCYRIGRKLWQEEHDIVILYLGDFDPSGLNISRIAKRKMESFAGKRIEWVRVAINEPQFERMLDQFGIFAKAKDKLKPAYLQIYRGTAQISALKWTLCHRMKCEIFWIEQSSSELIRSYGRNQRKRKRGRNKDLEL